MLLKYKLKITFAKHIPRICDLSRVPESWRYKLPSETQREACSAAVYCAAMIFPGHWVICLRISARLWHCALFRISGRKNGLPINSGKKLYNWRYSIIAHFITLLLMMSPITGQHFNCTLRPGYFLDLRLLIVAAASGSPVRCCSYFSILGQID